MNVREEFAAALRGLTPEQQHKVEFVTNLCGSIRDQVIRAVPHMPAEWDGHELRELLALLFERERMDSMRKGRRAREFRNERAINPHIP